MRIPIPGSTYDLLLYSYRPVTPSSPASAVFIRLERDAIPIRRHTPAYYYEIRYNRRTPPVIEVIEGESTRFRYGEIAVEGTTTGRITSPEADLREFDLMINAALSNPWPLITMAKQVIAGEE
jgi:hypothetical protein